MDYKLRHYHQGLDTTLQGYADSSVPGIIEQTRVQLSVIMDMILLQHIAGGFHSISHTLLLPTINARLQPYGDVTSHGPLLDTF